ncbi:hypothetical protein WT26_24395 [Burkholderia cepacia]|uniref:Uncharacterized protein n=2 Tax=Burkholderia cepacia complex TaxID=87882 RepID=A0A1B4PYV5_BURCE|nr:hypothetical protein WT26_24395 [Burkholderia cepacia]AOK25866.1 hypothetical protein WK67_24300 [Burkholderia ubonensis]
MLLEPVDLLFEDRCNDGVRRVCYEIQAIALSVDQFLAYLRSGLFLSGCADGNGCSGEENQGGKAASNLKCNTLAIR